MVSMSADSSGDKRSSPLSINCSTAETIWSYSSSVSIALTTMRFASRAYFLGSTVTVALMISMLLSHTPCAVGRIGHGLPAGGVLGVDGIRQVVNQRAQQEALF